MAIAAWGSTATAPKPTGSRIAVWTPETAPHDAPRQAPQPQKKAAPPKKGQSLSSKLTSIGKNVGESAVSSERAVATGVSRVLPGGLNDVKAQQRQSELAVKNAEWAFEQAKKGKLDSKLATKLIQVNLSSANQAQKSQSQTIKDMPSKTQLAAGFVGTGSDILLAGAKGVKALTVGGAVSGASAAKAGGGNTKQVIEQGVLGGVLPVAGSVLGRKLSSILVKDHSPAPVKISEKTVSTPVKEVAGESVGKGKTEAIDALSTKTKLNESGSVQLPKTNDYVNEQIKLQDKARKAGNPEGLAKVGAVKSDAKTKLIDSFAPIEDTLNKSKAKVAPEKNIKYQIDRALRADTIGAQYIKDKGLAKVIQSAPNVKELDQYLIAKHAADLEKGGIQTGRNLEADKQLIQDLGPQYEGHAKAVKQYSENLLDQATKYGLVSKETATHLKEKYPNYVPVQRIFGEGELPGIPKGVGGGKVSIASQSVVQKIKGSDRQIESPLSSLIDKTQAVVREGERNKAAQILTGYKDLPGNPFQLRELAKDEKVGTKPVVSYLDNGEVRRFETTPEIAAAAKSLNKEQMGLIGRILTVPTRVLRLGATGLNPAFALANVAKDTASAFINSSHPLRASVANPKVFVDALVASANHGSKRYGELVREGAGGTSFDIARNSPKQNLRSIRMQRNGVTKVAYTVTSPARLLRAAENTIGRSEEFNRAIQYFGNKQSALKKGLSTEQARLVGADAARNNTVNFARAGDYGRVLNSVLPYFNAGLQGSRTLLRNLKDRPVQTVAKLAVSSFFPVAAVTVWNTSDPKRKAAYDDIKEYEKQGSLIIIPPHPVKDPKTGKWNAIKIPVSQEIANLNNIVRGGVESAVHDGKLKLGQVIGNTVGTTTSLNTQSGRQLANQVTPQALKPGIETLTNQNLFTGNKIVPDSQKNLPAKDQVGPGTSKVATKLGKTLSLSPRQIDNTISTATGGLGTSVAHGKSLKTQVASRFTGATGQSSYNLADARFNALKGQLINLKGYKSLPSSEKAKALNRLQSSVQAAYVSQKDSKGKTKTPSKRQQATKGKPDLASYLKPQRR